MKKFIRLFLLGIIPMLALLACDLQPKILSLPDSVGEFISVRYPALLADPETQPEIYNSAASDYGVYASPELYGTGTQDDYLIYAPADDYMLAPDDATPATETVFTPNMTDMAADNDYLRVPLYGAPIQINRQELDITVAKGDTLYSLARAHNVSVEELAGLNKLTVPYALSPGQKLKVLKQSSSPPAPTPVKQIPVLATKVGIKEITVGAGDTLYSISRNYSIPVNDLAVMNKLTPPLRLSVGQKLKVPKLETISPTAAQPTRAAAPATKQVGVYGDSAQAAVQPNRMPIASAPTTAPAATKPKISSDPNKKLPALSARSSSKFSWPVRGKILSDFGVKSNGLFNDGINIGARSGAKVEAAENGVVAYAGNEVKGMGNLVIVQHTGGWMTVYAHMDDMSVRRGAKVNVGQKIGTVGKTGKVDVPQLHFEIRKGTKAYNPASYLNK